MIKSCYKQIDIARAIGKDKSVISRELKRNSDKRNGAYKYDLAHRKYLRRLITKSKSRKCTSRLKAHVEFLIREDFRPEQIAGRLKAEGKSKVSHERIYQHIWADLKIGAVSITIFEETGSAIGNEEPPGIHEFR